LINFTQDIAARFSAVRRQECRGWWLVVVCFYVKKKIRKVENGRMFF